MKYAKQIQKLGASVIIAFIFLNPIYAQEEIISAKQKKLEIELAVIAELNETIGRTNYALQVDVLAEKINNPAETLSGGFEKIDTTDELPGFEQTQKPRLIKPQPQQGDYLLIVKKIMISLILHKLISESKVNYIRQMVPIVGGLDFKRGDEFNFVSIEPVADPAEATVAEPEETTTPETDLASDIPQAVNETLPEEKGFLGFLQENWILIILCILLIALSAVIFFLLSAKKNANGKNDVSFLDLATPQKDIRSILENQSKEIKFVMDKQAESIRKNMEGLALGEKNKQLTKEVISDLLGNEAWTEVLVKDLFKNKNGMTKLGVIMSILGAKVSEQLFSAHLPNKIFFEILEKSKTLNINVEERSDVLHDIQGILMSLRFSVKDKKKTNPFQFLEELSTNQIGYLIKDESPRIKALIVARLKTGDAAHLLNKIPQEERSDVIQHFGKMDDIPLELVKNTAFSLANKALKLPDDTTVSTDGIKVLVDIIGFSHPDIRTSLINSMRTTSRKLSAEVEKKLFLFDSFPIVPPNIIAQVVRKLPVNDVIIAISNSEKDLKKAVIMGFPQNLQHILISKLKILFPLPDADQIMEKQKIIITEMQELAEMNKIDLKEINQVWEEKLKERKKGKISDELNNDAVVKNIDSGHVDLEDTVSNGEKSKHTDLKDTASKSENSEHTDLKDTASKSENSEHTDLKDTASKSENSDNETNKPEEVSTS